MLPLPTHRRRRLRAVGFTLLEVLVTLILLGVAAAIVAPVIRVSQPPDEGIQAVLAGARDAAVRRAQTLVLSVGDLGQWQLAPANSPDLIARGQFRDGPRDLRIRVNALGACFNEGAAGPVALDAISCTITTNRNARR
jgi:prepilin-type N-terminal cleavage/methylation domain-containing protein